MGGGGGGKPKATAQEKALAKAATQKFQIYEEHYRPLAKEQLEGARATKNKKNTARGIINADANISQKGRVGKIAASGLARGLKLGDARVQAEQHASNKARRAIQGHAEAKAVTGVENRERAAKLRHVKLGHGLASQTQQSLGGQAQTATYSAISAAQNELAESQAFAQGLGQFAGAAYTYGGGLNFGSTS